MAVEVYMQEETQDVVTDPVKNDEWKALIEKAGLTGQAELLVQKDKSPVPFLPMNQSMARVYLTLCPTRVSVDMFNRCAIPIRVLSAIALSKQEGYFKEMEVWYDDSGRDPIVVGFRENRWSDDGRFIIARWGDELRSFIELKKLALERKTADMRHAFEKQLASVEHDAHAYFEGGNVHVESW